MISWTILLLLLPLELHGDQPTLLQAWGRPPEEPKAPTCAASPSILSNPGRHRSSADSSVDEPDGIPERQLREVGELLWRVQAVHIMGEGGQREKPRKCMEKVGSQYAARESPC